MADNFLLEGINHASGTATQAPSSSNNPLTEGLGKSITPEPKTNPLMDGVEPSPLGGKITERTYPGVGGTYNSSTGNSNTPLVKTPRGYDTDLPVKGEVRDHIIPIALGGSSKDSNLNYQSTAEGHYKDQVEFYLIDQVKAGKMPLSEARAKILDWKNQDIPGQQSYNKANAPDMSPLGIAKGAIKELPNTLTNFVNYAKGFLGGNKTQVPVKPEATGPKTQTEAFASDPNKYAPPGYAKPNPSSSNKISQAPTTFNDTIDKVLAPFRAVSHYVTDPLFGDEKQQANEESLINTYHALSARIKTGYQMTPDEKQLYSEGQKIENNHLTQQVVGASGGMETTNMFQPTSEIVDSILPKLEQAVKENPENVGAANTLDILKNAKETGNIHPAIQQDILQRVEQIKPEGTLGTVEQAKDSIAQNIVDEIINNPAKEIPSEATPPAEETPSEQVVHEDVVKQTQDQVAKDLEKVNPELATKISNTDLGAIKSFDELSTKLSSGLSVQEKGIAQLAISKAVNGAKAMENKMTDFSLKNPTLTPKTQMTNAPKEISQPQADNSLIKNQGEIPKGLQPLAEEAKKYNSVDEFVNHYSSHPNEIPVSDEYKKYLSDQEDFVKRENENYAKIQALKDKYKDITKETATPKQLKQEAIDRVEYQKLYEERNKILSQKTLAQSPEGEIKTHIGDKALKSQLTDLYNQVTRKVNVPEPKKTGPIQLNVGIDPGIDKFIEQDLKPVAKGLGEGVAKTWDFVNKLINPVGRGDLAKMSAETLRIELAKTARAKELLYDSLKGARKTLDRYSKQQSLDFIDKLETGNVDGESKQFAQIIKDALQSRWSQIQEIKKSEAYIENYFPHIWKDPEKAGETLAKYFGKRPLEGTKSYLKQRKIPTVKEGVALGLEPVSYNPVDIVMARIVDMDRFLMAHNVIDQFKEDGLWKFIKMGDKLPSGWKFIDDKIARTFQFSEIAKGLILRGSYAMPEQSALILHNYLSPGISSNPIYQGIRMAGNSLNQVQLGLSAFHATFTSMDAITSKAALSLQKIFTEPTLLGKAGALARFISTPIVGPYYTIENFVRGNKLLTDYYKKNPEIPEMVDALVKAGGRAQMDSFYKNNSIESMFKALRQGNLVGAAIRTPWAMIEALAHPIMGYLVPRQKLGVFSDMASHILNTAERENWTEREVVQHLQEAWDSVDNRMGQMVYDNLFWNKTLKDLGMASTRSLGWNLGTIREVGGGLKEFGTIPFKYGYQKFKGEQPDFEMNPKMAYSIALPFVIGMWGAMIYYLYNGKGPETLLDYYYPTDAQGNRISLPSYMKDVFAYKTQPVQTVANKLHPLLGAILEMIQNKDYYGSEIRNINDPIVKQLEDSLGFMAKQFEPFSLSGAMKANQQGAGLGSQAASFFGFMPAPSYINQTPMQQKIFAAYQQRFGTSIKTKDQTQAAQLKSKIRNAYTNGDTQGANELLQQAIDAGIITAKGASTFIKNSDIPADVRAFKGLPKEDQANLLRGMSLQDLERYAWYSSDKNISGLSNAAKQFVKLVTNGQIKEPQWKQGKEITQ